MKIDQWIQIDERNSWSFHLFFASKIPVCLLTNYLVQLLPVFSHNSFILPKIELKSSKMLFSFAGTLRLLLFFADRIPWIF